MLTKTTPMKEQYKCNHLCDRNVMYHYDVSNKIYEETWKCDNCDKIMKHVVLEDDKYPFVNPKNNEPYAPWNELKIETYEEFLKKHPCKQNV